MWRAVSPAVFYARAGRLVPKLYLEMFASLDCNAHIACRPGTNLRYVYLLHVLRTVVISLFTPCIKDGSNKFVFCRMTWMIRRGV
jgi:hypothetical protein